MRRGALKAGLLSGSDNVIVQKSGQKVVELLPCHIGCKGCLGSIKLGAGIFVPESLSNLVGFFIEDLQQPLAGHPGSFGCDSVVLGPLEEL